MTRNLFNQDMQTAGSINRTGLHYVDGRMMNEPLRITAEVRINPLDRISGLVDEHLRVGTDGTTHYDTADGVSYYSGQSNPDRFDGKNYTRTLPRFVYMLDLTYNIGEHTFLTGGINYSRASGLDFINGNLGVGRYMFGDLFGVALNAGWHLNDEFYTIQYVTTEFAPPHAVFHDGWQAVALREASEKSFDVNFYFSCSINTKVESWPLNAIIQASWDRNDLHQYGSHADPFQSNVFSLTIGAVRQLGRTTRLITGCTLYQVQSFRNSPNPLYCTPLVQFEWGL